MDVSSLGWHCLDAHQSTTQKWTHTCMWGCSVSKDMSVCLVVFGWKGMHSDGIQGKTFAKACVVNIVHTPSFIMSTRVIFRKDKALDRCVVCSCS